MWLSIQNQHWIYSVFPNNYSSRERERAAREGGWLMLHMNRKFCQHFLGGRLFSSPPVNLVFPPRCRSRHWGPRKGPSPGEPWRPPGAPKSSVWWLKGSTGGFEVAAKRKTGRILNILKRENKEHFLFSRVGIIWNLGKKKGKKAPKTGTYILIHSWLLQLRHGW